MSATEQKHIQVAGLDDIPTIHALAKAIWEPTYLPILEKEQVHYMFQEIYNLDALRRQMEVLGHTFLTLFVEGIATGFASFSAKAEDKTVYKLHKLYLLPGQQGKGLGNALIEEVSKTSKQNGAKWLELNVNRYNPSKGFYERIGFQILREEDIPIGPYWMNDYVMRKPL